MVVWLIWFFISIGGDLFFFVCLLVVVLVSVGMLLVYGLGRSIFNFCVGWMGVVLVVVSFGVIVFGFLMIIDVLLLFCWCGILWVLWGIFWFD